MIFNFNGLNLYMQHINVSNKNYKSKLIKDKKYGEVELNLKNYK